MTYQLCLYITGQSPASQRALVNLRDVCDRELAGRFELEVVDVLVTPSRVQVDKILATPTLLKKFPAPALKIIGDLSDREMILAGLSVVDGSSSSTADPRGNSYGGRKSSEN